MKDFDICQIYNGVDTQIFHPYEKDILKKEWHLDGKYIVMGMANKWFLPENQDAMQAMMGILNGDTKLMLIGCNNAQCKALQGHEHILPVGFVRDRVRLAQLYSMADVFVNVTHADTLPTVNMESICCGTPVVTYDSCGSPELVGENCGFVVPEGNAEALLEAVEKTRYMDRGLCSRYGQSHFDKNVCYEKYLDIYRDVIKMDVNT
jgi:glycosyltransferase involved in cell wall biosynthesis